MRFHTILIASLLFFACSKPSRQHEAAASPLPGYRWTKLLDSADWRKSYNFQLLNFRDTLWAFHSEGNWHSLDGKSWAKSPLPNAIHNLAFLDYVQYGNHIYGLGHFEGNIEQYQWKGEVYKTSNMWQWETHQSNFPKRFFCHPFVFEGKMWLIGGEDGKQAYDDIWSSADGIFWKKRKEALPFGPRSGSQIVQLGKRLFLLNNDVWSSEDALNWSLETKEIVKGEEIFGYDALVFDEKIWLLGCNRNGQFSSQVLVSSNGKEWQTQDAPWSPRGGIAAAVYQGKVYMTGGKYGGTPQQPDFQYSNDVWVLEKGG